MTFPPPASGISSQVWSTAERTVRAPVGRVRGELVRLLGQQGFTLTTDQLTLLEASRGSAFAGASKSVSKIPVVVKIRLAGGESDGPPTCSVWLDVRDGWKLPMGRPVSVYSQVLDDFLGAADDLLRRIDPGAAAFTPAQRSVHSPSGAGPWAGDAASAGGARDNAGGAIAKVSQAANRYLDNDPKDAPKGWRDRGEINIATSKGVATLPIQAVYGLVTAGTMVASRPGPMPPPLVAQVERVVAVVERALQAGSTPQNTWLRMGPGAIPVIEFLVQQAQIREAVPLRTLQVCVTCRLAKVVNPDYAKLRSRTTKLRTLQSSLGALLTTQGISPFVLIGKLSQMNQLDPEFVCPRCQGLHAENSIITFCSKCGEQRDESALRTCPKCQFDFRTLANTESLWKPPAAVPDAATFPGSSPAPVASEVAPTQVAPPFPSSLAASTGAESALSPTSVPAFTGHAAAPTASAQPPEPSPAPVQQLHLLPAWYPDPTGRHQFRWWDGGAWASFVLDYGRSSVDPLG